MQFIISACGRGLFSQTYTLNGGDRPRFAVRVQEAAEEAVHPAVHDERDRSAHIDFRRHVRVVLEDLHHLHIATVCYDSGSVSYVGHGKMMFAHGLIQKNRTSEAVDSANTMPGSVGTRTV